MTELEKQLMIYGSLAFSAYNMDLIQEGFSDKQKANVRAIVERQLYRVEQMLQRDPWAAFEVGQKHIYDLL